MKKTAYSLIFLIILLALSLFFVSCNGDEVGSTDAPTEESTEAQTGTPTEAPSDESTEDATNEPTEAPTSVPTETPTEEPTEAVTEYVGPASPACEKCNFKTVNDLPICTECGYVAECRGEHPYTSDINGHKKPACDKCGKGEGRVQNHEYEERVEDEGDLLLYVYRCSICRYVAYEQEVPYEIDSFYSAGDMAVAGASGFSSDYHFEAGVGYTAFSKSATGQGTVNIVQNGIMMLPSGQYMVVKLRMPASSNRFTLNIRSICAAGELSVPFENIEPGWVTLVIDITKAVSITTTVDLETGEDIIKGYGYQADANNLHYLFSCSLTTSTVSAAESFDIAYVMFCDSYADAENFTKNEKTVYTYKDCRKEEPEIVKKPCLDENGNVINHEYDCDAETHSFYNACYQCGRAEVYGEEHTFGQMLVNGELTYACSVCGYLQFGANVNKYITALEINNNAPTYYKVTKENELMTDGDVEFARFYGRSETAQVIFARNNYASSEKEEACAFNISTGDLFIIRMKTNAPEVDFSIYFRTEGGTEKSIRIPLTMTEADKWTTFAIDLSAALPLATVANEKGEYRIISLYYQIGTYSVKHPETGKNGADFTDKVYYDVNFMAFVDNWSELKSLVDDETVIKVNASNLGAVINTEKQECLGDHIWGFEREENTVKYLCANCETPLKIVELSDSVKKYYSGYEIARDAVTYAATGERNVCVDEDVTVYGRVKNCAEIWFSRHQQDYRHGKTGDALNNRFMDVGQAKYLVFRLRTDNNQKNFEFYISTTGKNGDGYSVAADGTVTIPTTGGMVTITSPVQASKAGEWTTYVINLEELIPEFYVKDAETGTYIIDTFGIPFSKDANMDVEFVAFVEGGWEEIDALTPDETVIYATHMKDKTYSILKTATGACEVCAYAYTATEVDGGVLYEYKCPVCGTVSASHKVSEEVNKFYALDTMTKYNATDNGIKEEDGVMYHSYSFSGKTGHVFVNGANKYTDMGDDTGSLLVLKYRASGDASVTLEAGTADKDVAASWGAANTVDGDVSKTQQKGDVATEWRVAVIDLSVYGYTCNADEDVQIRFTTASSQFDIAYAAIVDSEEEAVSLIGEGSYVFYADWAKAGVEKQ